MKLISTSSAVLLCHSVERKCPFTKILGQARPLSPWVQWLGAQTAVHMQSSAPILLGSAADTLLWDKCMRATHFYHSFHRLHCHKQNRSSHTWTFPIVVEVSCTSRRRILRMLDGFILLANSCFALFSCNMLKIILLCYVYLCKMSLYAG